MWDTNFNPKLSKVRPILEWSLLSSDVPTIARIVLDDIDHLASSVCSVIGESPFPYSGVVLCDEGEIFDGEHVEKACYGSGGYKFLLREHQWLGGETEDETLRTLVPIIMNAAGDYARVVLNRASSKVDIEALWVVCQREGDFATIHSHLMPGEIKQDKYSGMFYLCTPSQIRPDNFPSGCLHFVVDGVVVYCPPIEGSLVLWPSGFLHGVHPFRGPGDRVGVSFNVIFS